MDVEKPNKGILEQGVFGKNKATLWWVESRHLVETAKHIRDVVGMDVLEMISMMKLDEAYVLTYLFGNESDANRVALKLTMADNNKTSAILSISDIWPAARYWESRVSERYPIRFEAEKRKHREDSNL